MARNKYPEGAGEKILDAAEWLFVECGYEHDDDLKSNTLNRKKQTLET